MRQANLVPGDDLTRLLLIDLLVKMIKAKKEMPANGREPNHGQGTERS